MIYFTLIDELRTYFLAKGYFVIIGGEGYQNALNGDYVYDDYDKVAMIDFPEARPLITGGRIQGATYTGLIALGQKREDGNISESSLDETVEQKYDRRLEDLGLTLTNDIAQFACNQDILITDIVQRMEINQFDLNIDFVASDITFTDESL